MAKVPAQSMYLPYGASSIHVLKMGQGPKVMLAFHGFSELAAGFADIAPALAETHTLYAFDFPFHGRTDWQEDHDMDTKDLQAIIRQLAEKEGFTRFGLMGFSMGGRLCLSVAEAFLSVLDGVWLIAADGIRTHKVFNIATYPVWGRWVFKWVMKRPQFFFRVVNGLYKMRLLSKFLYDFTHNHMDTVAKRNRIFHTWISLKNFVPNVPVVQQQLIDHNIPVHLFFGERDEVIPPQVGEAFARGVPHATYDLVPKGHKLVHPILIPYLQKYL